MKRSSSKAATRPTSARERPSSGQGVLESRDGEPGGVGEEPVRNSRLPPEAERPPQDLAEHIPAAVVRRRTPPETRKAAAREWSAITREAARTVPDRRRRRRARGRPGAGLEEVGVVVGGDSLHHGREALEPHAGIHRGRRQRGERAGFVPVELHEDQIPDLEMAVVALEFRAEVVVDLGAGPAGAGIAHGPEVLRSRKGGDPCSGTCARRIAVLRRRAASPRRRRTRRRRAGPAGDPARG